MHAAELAAVGVSDAVCVFVVAVGASPTRGLLAVHAPSALGYAFESFFFSELRPLLDCT